jgi:nitroimidazol reductase NimA-like FMN-containing flavoprotein (pyridoxamine 5'-phosphate oxidase superfamily)
MIEIREMTEKDMEGLLTRVGYGHLGCARDNRPYVVPIQYIYDKSFIYIYTNDGKKAEILQANPQVCLQIEEVVDNGNWQSVVAEGTAKRVTDGPEAEAILQLMNSRITTPTPAMGITWINNWISAKKEMIFKIKIETLSGRTADKVDIAVASAVPARAKKPRIF